MTTKEKKLHKALVATAKALATYGSHLIIEKQVSDALGYVEKKKGYLPTERELEEDAVKHYKENDTTTRHWVDIVAYKWVWKRCYNHYFNKER